MDILELVVIPLFEGSRRVYLTSHESRIILDILTKMSRSEANDLTVILDETEIELYHSYIERLLVYQELSERYLLALVTVAAIDHCDPRCQERLKVLAENEEIPFRYREMIIPYLLIFDNLTLTRKRKIKEISKVIESNLAIVGVLVGLST